MSDQHDRTQISHNARLAITMFAGGFVSALFAFAMGLGPASGLTSPLVFAAGGVLAGLGVELFRRFQEGSAHPLAIPYDELRWIVRTLAAGKRWREVLAAFVALPVPWLVMSFLDGYEFDLGCAVIGYCIAWWPCVIWLYGRWPPPPARPSAR